ncbi:MAG: M20/M25/M40 family metallo-hydrolase [Fimbriimonadaceae bacterium]|nr:M20/M25/M40 family metallo-hydrolase [Chitinophagales bacterium]
MNNKYFFIFFLFLTSSIVFSQSAVEEKLKAHVTYLADDKLEGRATGSAGEKLAARYIVSNFMAEGIKPANIEGKNYLEEFTLNAGREAGKNNFIELTGVVPNERFDFFKDYNGTLIYPLDFSGNGAVNGEYIFCGYGITAPELNYDDYKSKNVKGKIAVIKVSTPEGGNPHSSYFKYIDERDKVKTAISNGAIAVVFINEDVDYPELEKDFSHNITPVEIPVIYYAKSFVPQFNKVVSIKISVELNQITKIGYNILAYIDNAAKYTIVVGGHYDHLGYGETGGSLYRGEPVIHNGADDNASGVALIMELAKEINASNFKNNNYLFIAFSGEEMGLYGSKAFTNSELAKKYDINYMLNYDMVGRLDSNKTLIINGVGTSPSWHVLNSIKVDDIKIKTTESGVGPSDQTSFYLKDIPVLHFFTGSHSDYHKPGDDAEKINYSGIESILEFSYALIDSLNNKGEIVFTKTKEDNNDNAPKFTVTLGVIPDYTFEGSGMRIDAVSDGKPAFKAGLLAGDVVIKLGEHDVVDLMSYMKALSKFNKGDATTVIINRNNSAQTFPIQF